MWFCCAQDVRFRDVLFMVWSQMKKSVFFIENVYQNVLIILNIHLVNGNKNMMFQVFIVYRPLLPHSPWHLHRIRLDFLLFCRLVFRRLVALAIQQLHPKWTFLLRCWYYLSMK